MTQKWDPKDPDEILDYEINWSAPDGARLSPGDTIVTSTWPVIPAGITKNSDSHTTTSSTIWLSGGTIGATYELTCRITTAGGRTHDQSVKLQVKAK